MEELINDLVKAYPNYYELGQAVHRIHLRLQEREKTPHTAYDKVDAKIEIKKILKELKNDTTLNETSFRL